MKAICLIPRCVHTVNIFSNNCVRNYARHIAGDNIVNLDKNTLTGRLMNYLKTQKTELNEETENFNTNDAITVLRNRMVKFMKIPRTKLVSVITSLENEEVVKSTKEFYRILRVVDEECCLWQHSLKASEMLDILDAYMNLIPNRVTELKFYKMAMNQLFTIKDILDRKDYMRYIFYIALMKKSVKSQKMLRQTLSLMTKDEVTHLSCEELCIVANSAFKTSTKVSNKNILEKVRNYLNDNLMLLKDPAVFVTLTKILRHNRYCDEDLLASISCALFFNKSFEFYTFQTYSHLLALYSDNLYYDEKLLEFLTQKCVNELKNDTSNKSGSEKIRSKDIVRFLWGMSNLNCTFLAKDDIRNIIVPKLIEKIKSSEMDVNAMVEVLLSLWILNYKCYELVPYILEKKNALNEVPDKGSTKQRLNQLLTCIYHEDRILFKQINIMPQGTPNFLLSQHLKDRPCLQNVLRSLKAIGFKMDMKFDVGYQIPYTNILGVTGYQKNIYKCVNIEVLDHFTTLKNTESWPSGLMGMKLRILDGCEEALIVIKENEIEDLTEAEVEQFLQDELDLVC